MIEIVGLQALAAKGEQYVRIEGFVGEAGSTLQAPHASGTSPPPGVYYELRQKRHVLKWSGLARAWENAVLELEPWRSSVPFWLRIPRTFGPSDALPLDLPDDPAENDLPMNLAGKGRGGEKQGPVAGQSERESISVYVPTLETATHVYAQTVSNAYRETRNASAVGQLMDTLKGETELGIQLVERLLPLGGRVVALGRLVVSFGGSENGSGATLSLVSPLRPSNRPFILSLGGGGLAGLLRSLRQRVFWYGVLAAVFGSLTAFLIWRRLRKRWSDWREARRMRELAEAWRRENGEPSGNASGGSLATNATAGGKEQEEKRCCVCWDAPIDTLIMDCRHLVLCSRCGERVDVCPLCREPISSTLKVYGF